jgi:hypothetical protein
MIGYATLGTNNLARAQAFYDALLTEIGAKRLMELPHGFTMYGARLDRPALAITPPYDGKEARPGNGNMLALVLNERAKVDALYKKALQLWSCPGSVDSLSSSFLDLVSIDLTPTARSAAAGGRSSGRIFSSVRRKSIAYKAPGAEISLEPWPWYPRKFHAARVGHS